jgi:hypothetical protein
MRTFGWTGSRTTYYALYEAPLRSLENHPIGAVRRWAKTMLGHMMAGSPALISPFPSASEISNPVCTEN